MHARLSLALLPASLLVAAAPLAAGGGETALSASESARVTTLFEEMLTFESSCTEACGKTAKAKMKKAKAAGANYDYAKAKKAGECGGCGEVNPTAALMASCSENEGSWTVLEPLIAETFTASSTEEEKRTRILDMLAWSPSEASLACADGLLDAKPAAFAERHLLAFAQRGSEGSMEHVVKHAKKGAVVPAAFLALRGDESGSRTLAKAARPSEVTPDSVSEALLAGVALRALGDEKSLTKLRKKVHSEVLERLDGGDLEGARSIALRAQHADAVLRAGKNALLGNYGELADKWCMQHSEKVAQADQVFELIEKLTPM